MNPNIDKFPMPDAGPNSVNVPNAEFGAPGHAIEQVPPKDTGSFAPPQPTATPSPIVSSSVPGPQITQAAPVPSTAQAAGLSAVSGEGEDLIKKWIEVAKTIVERTKDNPYLQSQQLSKAGTEFRKQTGRSLDPSKE